MSIFISSTCYDLLDLRAELAEFFRAAGVSVRMSDCPASDFEVLANSDSIETCLANVRRCDAFVIVLSQRYGPRLGKAGYVDVSATHLEYREAVKAGKPIRMYVRDRLDGEFSLWKKNGSPADMKFPWCKDLELFQVMEEHTKLVAKQARSNWVTTFQDSVDLKEQLARDFRSVSARAMVDALTKSGRVPYLEVKAFYCGEGQDYIWIELFVRNLGGVMAVAPNFTFPNNLLSLKVQSLAPGESAELRFHWTNIPRANMSLSPCLAYSSTEGHKFIEHGVIKVEYPIGQREDHPAITYELLERKYDGFYEAVLLKAE